MAGRYVILTFFGPITAANNQDVLLEILKRREVFDGDSICFFGVSTDPQDENLPIVRQPPIGVRFFWDSDREVSQLYGADATGEDFRRFSVVLDERLRVLQVFDFEDSAVSHAERLISFVKSLPRPAPESSASLAPVLLVPRIFEPELCRRLIHYYEAHGGVESGVMREVDGKTVSVADNDFKQRRDCEIVDDESRLDTMHRIHDRLVPEIQKAFQFRPTRIERYIVACYDSVTGGHFAPHRDNTTCGTAHRQFAVSINLNSDFEGGNLRFPEYGRQTYRPTLGGAVVFSCTLLHEATPITSGTRYAFLPFLYDDAAAAIRQQNLIHLR